MNQSDDFGFGSNPTQGRSRVLRPANENVKLQHGYSSRDVRGEQAQNQGGSKQGHTKNIYGNVPLDRMADRNTPNDRSHYDRPTPQTSGSQHASKPSDYPAKAQQQNASQNQRHDYGQNQQGQNNQGNKGQAPRPPSNAQPGTHDNISVASKSYQPAQSGYQQNKEGHNQYSPRSNEKTKDKRHGYSQERRPPQGSDQNNRDGQRVPQDTSSQRQYPSTHNLQQPQTQHQPPQHQRQRQQNPPKQQQHPSQQQQHPPQQQQQPPKQQQHPPQQQQHPPQQQQHPPQQQQHPPQQQQHPPQHQRQHNQQQQKQHDNSRAPPPRDKSYSVNTNKESSAVRYNSNHGTLHLNNNGEHQPRSPTTPNSHGKNQPTQGHTNKAYIPDDTRKTANYQASQQNLAPQKPDKSHYENHTVKHHPEKNGHSYQNKAMSSSTHSLAQKGQDQKHDPLANPYAMRPSNSQQEDPLANPYAKPPGNQSPPGSYHNTSYQPLTYGSSYGVNQSHSPAENQYQTLSARDSEKTMSKSPVEAQPDGQGKRKYEKRSSNVPNQAQPPPPRSTKRGRILSQNDPNQSRSPQQPQSGSNPGTFQSVPPQRAHSVSQLHINLTPDPSSSNTSNLHRPLSVPNISSAVSALERGSRLSLSSTTTNGEAKGGMGIWKSKSLLDLAMTDDTNLRRTASLASLVATNPAFARRASTQILYERKIEKGEVPNDHKQTLVLAIIATVIFFPVGIPLLVFTMRNEPTWKEDLDQAMSTNNNLFMASVCTIIFGIIFWITMIVIISLNFA